MKRNFVNELQSLVGTNVYLCGWVDKVRNQKRMIFLIMRDKTGKVQITIDKLSNPELAKVAEVLTVESTIAITGLVQENQAVKLSQIEVLPTEITVFSIAEPGLPIDEESSLDIRLDWRYLDLRQPKNALILEVQTAAEAAMREFWLSNGFVEIHSPKLMGAASESGAELFRLDYFGGFAYLAQSPQFYKQMAMAAGLERVFEIGPVFRANPSFTSRHDTEFTSVDVEVSWVESYEDVMRLEEQWLVYVLERISSQLGEKIQEHFGMDVVIPSMPFPRITLKEAKSILAAQGHRLSEDDDLDPEGERLLAKYIENEYGHQFVFVTDYPAVVRAFYHMRPDDDKRSTKSFDLIWNGLEVTTGAQREHRYDRLEAQALEKGISLDSISHYLDFFRYGCPPHGGYGFGLTRMLMILLGLKNVREVTYVYRGPNRLLP